MREAEFREWLGRRRYGGKELTTVNHRLASCRSVERALPALGFEEGDLDAVHAAGRWDALLSAMSKLRSDWRNNEGAARVIAPQAENPAQQMANARNAIGQYGHFAKGDDPNYDESAGELGSSVGTDRPFVLFDAAGLGFKPVKHGNQQTGLSAYRVKPRGASNRSDDALEVESLAEVARLVLIEGLAARMQSLRGGTVNYLGYGKQKLVRYELDPALAEEIGVPAKGQVQELGNAMTDEQILARFDGKEEFARWFEHWSEGNRQSFFRLARAMHDAGLDWYHVNIDRQVRCGRKKKGAVDATEVFVAISNLEPSCWVRRDSDRAALKLPETAVSMAALADAIEAAPAALGRFSGGTAYWPDELSADPVPTEDKIGISASSAGGEPTNLILYGPPGTGKTYATAAEAVRLCDGLTEDDPFLEDAGRRSELRSRYDQLVEAGQVRLVTFHQSYSYEEFVEGLRPVTGGAATEEGGAQGAGFRLEAKRGVFREICAVAEEARKNAGRRGGLDLAGRRIYKMSLGRAGLEDHIFEAAIAGRYVVLGYGGEIDWSDPRFADWSAIMDRWRQAKPDATGNDPNVVQMWPFRTMKEGDLVIVSEGNSHFRAIAEVTGPYRYEPTDVRDYNHRRSVKWLLVPDEALPVETIYGKNFMMQSCYQLKDALLKKEALARLLPGGDAAGHGAPDQFVLVIDEINRANISKVFGELITLIEPNKRLGAGREQLAAKLPYSGDSFGVPANLHIVGTMNTADRSIALLDTALRRRFTFRELPPRPELLDDDVEGVPLRRVLEVMNDRIEYLVDRDHCIGHAFFMGEGGKDRAAIGRTMRDKVIPLLQEYFFEDWSRVAAVLGARPGKGGGFLACRKLRDPTGQGGEDRLSWSVRDEFSADAYVRLVRGGEGAPGEEEEAAAAES